MAKYEVDRFESPPDPDLVCCICQCVLYKPLESPCQHVFCKVCIETWLTNRKNCPNCRKSLRVSKLKPVLPIVRNMINRLLMKCDNRSHGCREKIKLEYYDTHIKECGFVPLKCMNTGCEFIVLRKDMLAHEKQCQFRLVVCKKGCGMPIAAEQEHSHSCVAVLKDNIKAMEEAHNRKYKDFEKRLKKLEEQVEQILANNEGNDDYSDYASGSATPTYDNAGGDDYDDPMRTPEYYGDYTPTSDEMNFQGPLHHDDYADGRDTPINGEDPDSFWSWLNEESTASGEEYDDGHSETESPRRGSQDWGDGVERTNNGGSSENIAGEPSSPEHGQQESGRGTSSQVDHSSSFSLRSASNNGTERSNTETVSETDEQVTATSSSGSTNEVVNIDLTPDTSSRRGEQRGHSSATSQEESPSSSSGASTMPISLRLDQLAELDTASDRTWSPSTRSDERQENGGQQTATSSTSNSRGTSDNASRSEGSRRSDRSTSNEGDRRRRSRNRRRSTVHYSSDEDRSRRGSRRSSTKKARRR